jgi:hypothetical protein
LPNASQYIIIMELDPTNANVLARIAEEDTDGE